MSSKFFSSRKERVDNGKYNTKTAKSARTNNKKQNTGMKKSGRGR